MTRPGLLAEAQRLFSRLQRRREQYIRAYCARYDMYPSGRYVELFARRQRPGWLCMGDEMPPARKAG